MPIHTFSLRFFVFLACTSSFVHAMVYDNRYFPLLKKPWLGIDHTRSFLSINVMAANANSSVDERQKEIGLPEIYGDFELTRLARAIEKSGKPNPLRSDLRNSKLAYRFNGTMQMQGINCEYQQEITDLFAIGLSWAFMRVNNHYEFRFNPGDSEKFLGPSDLFEIDEMRRKALCEIGLDAGNSATLGVADVDFYVRMGKAWDYTLKFRHIDAGLRLGALLPAAARSNLNKLSSIPLGGDGRWGMYGAGDILLELREDMKVGFYTQIGKRIGKTRTERIQILQEGPLFGAVLDQAHVNPGFTLVFSPYFMMEHLQYGLGACIQYNLVWHQKDSWKKACPRACDGTNLEYNVKRMELLSEWTAEYITLEGFYDFGSVKLIREFDPVLCVQWDFPVKFFSAKRVFSTNRVSIGLTFAF